MLDSMKSWAPNINLVIVYQVFSTGLAGQARVTGGAWQHVDVELTHGVAGGEVVAYQEGPLAALGGPAAHLLGGGPHHLWEVQG